MSKIKNIILGISSGVIYSSCVVSEKKTRPNIIFILADDLGYGDISFYNNTRHIRTPILDSLARNGISFTNAHSSASVSTPTRYGLMTGQYPWRGPLKSGVLWTWADPLIDKDIITLPEMLKEIGYSTALIGKWHLGIKFPTFKDEPIDRINNGINVDYSKLITDGPINHGFDYYYGDDVPNFPPYVYIENDHFTEIPTKEFPKRGMPGVPGIMSDNWSPESLMPIQVEKSIEYIRNNKKMPFFLMVSLTSPHTPIAPNPEFVGKSGAGRYGDFVQEMDTRIGHILSTLKNEGIEDNTIIIFSSDNGSSFQDGGSDNGEKYAGSFGSILNYGHNPSLNFRGMKSDIWEGGHRIPFIISWSNFNNKNKIYDNLICDLDIYATLADYFDISLESNQAIDSKSIIPMLQSKSPNRKSLVSQSGNGHLAYTQDEYKLIASSGSGGSLNKNEESGDMPYFDIKTNKWHNVQLYDKRNDASERFNIAKENHDIVNEMINSLVKEIKFTNIKLWKEILWIENK